MKFKNGLNEMRKPVVVIIKASPWKSSHLFKSHPEYSAISNLVERHASNMNFVVTGTSKTPICSFLMKNNVIACDIPVTGITGHFNYHLHLFRIFLQYQPRLIIVLGLTAVLPALTFSFLSPKFKCTPVFIGEFDYHGRRTVGRLLNYGQFKLMSLILRVSRTKMPNIFALSKFVRDGIEKLAPNLKGKIALVSYPISPVFYSAKRESAGAFNEPYILTVAGIEPRKGLDVLVKAVSLIPRELRPRVIIKGQIRDPIYMQQLNIMVANMGLGDKIVFVTNTIDYDALVSYYQSATLFVFPTREDSLGVVLLEALHSGLPVVATSVGGIPDIIENGVNGILVKPDDPQELANAILLLLKDNTLRMNLARNAVQVLHNRYYNRATLEEAFEKSIKSL
jgi:glycosyltransferase involved in cell wall biosynthesis